ncbi:MAG TPA: aminotransferase class III-fold pyridoxal phosphate-dependent enzyme, partial [Candidatus Atribacteria bacterium]|nr:aminotransferase class III-fold pyridoxal phosphate-dependent enzyme [Candidatus Atribacteria bacterium]
MERSIKSNELFKEALSVMPAGVTSNFRAWEKSIVAKRAYKGHIVDVDGKDYIDYRLGFGPVILGHGYPKITKKILEVLSEGNDYAFTTELEIKVAKKMKKMCPCIDLVRFVNSGTEATMHAIRVARAYTGKEKIIKFEGHYHGMYDYMLFSTYPSPSAVGVINDPIKVQATSGIPSCIKDLVITLPWNNFEAIEKVAKREANNVAAIITEPVMGNMNSIMPKEGYLKHLKEVTEDNDILLIFDEVKTGFRMAEGGAQEIYNVKPDLACYAKAMGNGFPVGAFGGIKEIMELIGPEGVAHGGTFTGNAVSMAAVDATLEEISGAKVIESINDFGNNLIKGIGEVMEDNNINYTIQGFPGMFGFFFTELEEVRQLRDIKYCDM